MPARTNDFQELVTLIQMQMAPKGAKVTVSNMEAPDGLTTEREADITIEGPFGPYKIKIAVEAKDEGRLFDLGKFDSLLGKYFGPCGLLINKLIIVTRRGFTAGVIEKAQKSGVELLTLDEAKTKQWSNVTGFMRFRHPPHICGVQVDPPIGSATPQELLQNGRLICPNNHDHGLLQRHLLHLVYCHWLPHNQEMGRQFEEFLQRSSNGQAKLNFTWKCGGHSIRLSGTDYPLNEIKASVHVAEKRETTKCKHTLYEQRSVSGETEQFHHFESIFGDQKLQLLFPNNKRPDKLIFRINPLAKNRKARRAEKKNMTKRAKTTKRTAKKKKPR